MSIQYQVVNKLHIICIYIMKNKFGFLAQIIWLCNLLTLSVPDESY